MKKKTRLTIINGQEGTESSNGDVLIFPDMIKYRGLTQSDVNDFIEEVLVKETQWLPKKAETLKGSYIYVCAHGSRDKRCGFCGPVLIKKFQEEINARGLQDKVFVSPCSHIGGHKYAGNVIIFSPSINGEVTGHWYGYVAPEDVIVLLEQHIGKGQIIDHLWRGQMGLSQEEQKTAHNLRLQPNNDAARQTGCCGGSKASNCCQAMPSNGKQVEENNDDKVNEKSENIGEVRKPKGTSGARKTCSWFERWERQDTYAALAVVAAVASIAVAYSCYKQMK
ncbi:Altered inheritance of mitochondria protein 32 [Ananas comosus]|nr:Altered inheritance of mitochondria protein 32 [Ananas comosus]